MSSIFNKKLYLLDPTNRNLRAIIAIIKALLISCFLLYKAKNVRTVVLTMGFPHAGSSLVGYLITAHPNIIFADEPYNLYQTKNLHRCTLNSMFYVAIYREQRQIYLKKRYMQEYPTKYFHIRIRNYMLIPNQYQGWAKSLKIIGIKESERHINSPRALEMLNLKLKSKKIATKYIFTVRNPYDMIATRVRYNDTSIEHSINAYKTFCEKNKQILRQNNPQNIFFSRHENMIENPKQQLHRLCDFLSVSVSDAYLNDCAAQVSSKQNKSRFEYDWTQAQKREVMSLIEKYDFLSGYSWEA